MGTVVQNFYKVPRKTVECDVCKVGIQIQNYFKVPHTKLNVMFARWKFELKTISKCHTNTFSNWECDACKVGIRVEKYFKVPHKTVECDVCKVGILIQNYFKVPHKYFQQLRMWCMQGGNLRSKLFLSATQKHFFSNFSEELKLIDFGLARRLPSYGRVPTLPVGTVDNNTYTPAC